ncbi:hypothetical protein SCHPADRAFT_825926 [Schizopora paradoxa]|uniref:DNA breaking-rejoining enzyme n=1 Tax=Schizopora paradoxa TaxID=27342 RepID=A0A0H2RSX3_9AGAM|nr:hypothetical protein SCHPADRAFT_825926 [Schizopora paradoxa]
MASGEVFEARKASAAPETVAGRVSTQSGKRKARTSKPSKTPAASLETLTDGKEKVVKQHLKAQRTTKSYDGHVARGREFLAKQCELGRRTKGSLLDDPEFELAFSDKPNKHSPEALVFYLTQKGFVEELSMSTIDCIYSAFKDFWTHLAGSKYRGEWGYDEKAKEWRGNPADSAEVQDLRTALKHKVKADGRIRNHAVAMSYEYMQTIMAWSERECPAEMCCRAPSSMEERTKVTKHLRLRAFASTGFTLFARNNEMTNLRRNDVTFGCRGPPPYHQEHIKVTLAQRKGWQHRTDKNPEADGQTYHIYDQPTKHAINSFVHLKNYTEYLEKYHGDMKPTDYIFPMLGSSGVLQPGSPISNEAVQEMLDWAVSGSGIPEKLSSHCFRRGGAQYRFMFAPIGERWTLARIRWWGGWAPGESVRRTCTVH